MMDGELASTNWSKIAGAAYGWPLNKQANSPDVIVTQAEGMGLEPTTGFPATDFESAC